MPSGKQIGEYSMKSTSLTLAPGPGGSMVITANFEGTATGFGTIVGTGTFVGGKSGTFSYCGAAYLDNGDTNSGLGTGTYESVGQHRWHTAGILQLSDGSAFISEGEIDLASRSWKGKMFEKN